MYNNPSSYTDSDDENTPLFDENMSPRSLRLVCSSFIYVIIIYVAVLYTRLLVSYRPISTPSRT